MTSSGGDLAQTVRRVEFRLALRGYDVTEVDRFLEAVAARLDSRAPFDAGELTGAQFRRSLKGYNQDEVDAFLGDLASKIDRTGEGARQGST